MSDDKPKKPWTEVFADFMETTDDTHFSIIDENQERPRSPLHDIPVGPEAVKLIAEEKASITFETLEEMQDRIRKRMVERN